MGAPDVRGYVTCTSSVLARLRGAKVPPSKGRGHDETTMRVLIMTKIFPNRLEPLSSPFNRQQFAALGRFCEVDVVATIPWFPGAWALRRWSRAGRLLDVPNEELIDGLPVHHPRFAYVPRVGHAISGPLYAASLATFMLRYRGRVDVLLGSWAYPDGFAAIVLASLLGVPAVIPANQQASDVLLPTLPAAPTPKHRAIATTQRCEPICQPIQLYRVHPRTPSSTRSSPV